LQIQKRAIIEFVLLISQGHILEKIIDIMNESFLKEFNAKMKEFRSYLAAELKKEKENNNMGIYYYLCYCHTADLNNSDLPKDQQDKMSDIFRDVCNIFVKYLEDNCHEGLPEDFDLLSFSIAHTSIILDKHKVKGDIEQVTEILMIALFAAFRMWYEHITNKDVIAFFEDKEHVDLPSMDSCSETYEWALDHNIKCTNPVSLNRFI